MPTNHSNNSGRHSTQRFPLFYIKILMLIFVVLTSGHGYCLLTVQLVITHSDETNLLFFRETEEPRKSTRGQLR